MHQKFGENRTCSSEDNRGQTSTRTDTRTDKHAHHNTPLPYRRRSKNANDGVIASGASQQLIKHTVIRNSVTPMQWRRERDMGVDLQCPLYGPGTSRLFLTGNKCNEKPAQCQSLCDASTVFQMKPVNVVHVCVCELRCPASRFGFRRHCSTSQQFLYILCRFIDKQGVQTMNKQI